MPAMGPLIIVEISKLLDRAHGRFFRVTRYWSPRSQQQWRKLPRSCALPDWRGIEAAIGCALNERLRLKSP